MPIRPPTFKPLHHQSKAEKAQEYNERRGTAHERGYTARWQKVSTAFKREHPLCCGCEAVGWIEASEVVDHIIPHGGNEQLFWDRSNWQACCTWHHDVVKQRLEVWYRQGRIQADVLDLTSETAKAVTLQAGAAGGGGGSKL